MPEWEAEFIVDEALARRLIAGRWFTPRTLTLLGAGWDNTVWLVDERWVFRFPRRAMAIAGVRREIAVLPQLRLPLPIPVPRFVGEPADGFPWPFFGAELIPGHEPLGLGDEERRALGRPLGEFLRALHDAEVDAELPDDPMGRGDMTVRVGRTRESIAAAGLVPPPGVLEAAAGLGRPPAVAVAHGDLHFRHIVMRDGRLAGVIDWGDVCRGDPGIDLPLYWSTLTPEGREAFLDAYGPVSEERLLIARVLALMLCAILARYAAAEGLRALEREALAGYERASRAL